MEPSFQTERFKRQQSRSASFCTNNSKHGSKLAVFLPSQLSPFTFTVEIMSAFIFQPQFWGCVMYHDVFRQAVSLGKQCSFPFAPIYVWNVATWQKIMEFNSDAQRCVYMFIIPSWPMWSNIMCSFTTFRTQISSFLSFSGNHRQTKLPLRLDLTLWFLIYIKYIYFI